MVFLWGFGIIVEGKIGWWRFLLVYIGISAVRSAVEQGLMLGYAGPIQGSGGASGVIFGLLAMALVWAPKNEVTCLLWFFIRGFIFNMTILWFALIYIGANLLIAWLTGFAMSSEMIHLLGAAVGLVVATVMLKLHWVDCENWDLFAVLSGNYGGPSRPAGLPVPEANTSASRKPAWRWTRPWWKRSKRVPADSTDDLAAVPPAPSPDLSTRRTTPSQLERIRYLLASGRPHAALNEYRIMRQKNADRRLGERDLRALIEGLGRLRAWTDAVPLLEEFVERFPDRSPQMRMRLAAIYLEQQRRPRAALKLIEHLDERELPERFRPHVRSLIRRARRLIDEGVFELDGEAWPM